MNKIEKIQLDPSCILSVPFHNYDQDFLFIVNNEEFKTSRIVSDILSPKICKIHSIDPTFDTFSIYTRERGNFSNILQLVNFNQISYPESELPFLFEVIEILETEMIEYFESSAPEEITESNVFSLIQHHEKYGKFYSKRLDSEIDFISSHFFELCEKHEEDLKSLQINTLCRIICNDKLELDDEDQLLKYVNSIYSDEPKYSILYESVLFENASAEPINEFVGIFNMNDLTNLTWKRICQRMKRDIENKDKNEGTFKNRYHDKSLNFPFSEENVFNGIIKYLRTKSSCQIENKLNVTASSYESTHYPINATIFDDETKFFHSKKEVNSWICFDFKEHRVAPTKYTLKSKY